MKLILRETFSFTKIVLSLCFLVMVLVGFYMPTTLDFVNIMTFYMPFLVIIFTVNVVAEEKKYGMEEIIFIQTKNSWKFLFIKFILIIFYYLVLLFMGYVLYQIFTEQSFSIGVSTWMYFCSAGMSGIFFGVLAMTFSNITKNSIISYGLSLFYWIYWNVNLETKSILNPFPFLIKPSLLNDYFPIQAVIVVLLLILNLLINEKSPYFIKDKIRNNFLKLVKTKR